MTDAAPNLITPETHPDHSTVGRYFTSGSDHIYYCDSYDPRIGFWMTSVNPFNPRRTNVSERAIDRTFHTLRERDHKPGTFHCYSMSGWSGEDQANEWIAKHREYLTGGGAPDRLWFDPNFPTLTEY